MHRDGFADIRRTEARSLRLETPRERRRRAPAAHLHLNAAPCPLVPGSEVPGTLRSRPETLRRRVMPTKGTVLEITSEPSDIDWGDDY